MANVATISAVINGWIIKVQTLLQPRPTEYSFPKPVTDNLFRLFLHVIAFLARRSNHFNVPAILKAGIEDVAIPMILVAGTPVWGLNERLKFNLCASEVSESVFLSDSCSQHWVGWRRARLQDLRYSSCLTTSGVDAQARLASVTSWQSSVLQ